jgi:acyl dehydratase
MPGPAFLLFQPMAALSEIPAVHVTAGTIVEDAVYAIEPQLSHISREFAAQGREFWTKLP